MIESTDTTIRKRSLAEEMAVRLQEQIAQLVRREFGLRLAGHENSKVTMDIYAKVKYNKPAQLHGVINRAIDTSKED